MTAELSASETAQIADDLSAVATQYPHLPRAPIVEAVIDWRAKLAPEFDVMRLLAASEKLDSGYALLDEQREFHQTIEQKPGTEPKHTFGFAGVRGYRFRSTDALHFATLKHDGFSFSRLKPYTNWRSVFNEAVRLWGIYRDLAEPEEVSRIAVRYINRILLPIPVTDFGKYLTAPPSAPPGAPQLMTSLLYRVVVHEPEDGVSANISQVIEGYQPGSVPLILDIDAFIMKNMDPYGFDFATQFESLRRMKNRIFFATLTPTAIQMFK